MTDKRTVAGQRFFSARERIFFDFVCQIATRDRRFTAALGIIYMEDVCANAGARPPTHVSFMDEDPRARVDDFALLPISGQAPSRNNIDLRPVEISNVVLASEQEPRATVSRLRFRSRKELYPMKVSSPFASFTLSSTGADGKTLISPFRGFRRGLLGSANTNLT